MRAIAWRSRLIALGMLLASLGCVAPAWAGDGQSMTTGACCRTDGVCVIATEEECADGAWMGPDTLCDPNPCAACPVTITGLPITIVLQEVLVGGVPAAAGDAVCIQDESQARLPVGYTPLSGSYPVAGTAWEGDPAHNLPGAVCGNLIAYALRRGTTGILISDPIIFYDEGDELFCGEPFSLVRLEFPAAGACCHLDGSCSISTAAYCQAAGGTYLGDDFSCEGDPDPCTGIDAISISWGQVKSMYR